MPRIHTITHHDHTRLHLDLDQLESIVPSVNCKESTDSLLILTFKSGQRIPLNFEDKQSALHAADELKTAWVTQPNTRNDEL